MEDARSNNLGRVVPVRRSAKEPLHMDGAPIGVSISEFWEWSGSDLLSNTQRGFLAEYIVALAVGGGGEVRTAWDAFDVVASDSTRIEVKSASYLQAWAQTKLSPISFDIAPKQAWDAETNTSTPNPVRSADVYVFAVLAHKDQATVDPLNLSQWEFYVLGTEVLDREVPTQKTISLDALEKLHPHRCDFSFISRAVKFALETQSPSA